MHPLSVFPSSFIVSFIHSRICPVLLLFLGFILRSCQYVHT
jgi:hypothetical protein